VVTLGPTARATLVQLNKQLCNFLGEGFTKKRVVLEKAFASVSTLATTDQKKVLQEIHMVAKCAEALVQKCLCKESSWLDGAITLANVKEDVVEILPTSTCNKTTKVKRLREDEFCVFCFSFVWVLFCGGSFFFTFLSSLEIFLSPRILSLFTN